MLEETGAAEQEELRGLFERVVAPVEGFHLLEPAGLAEVLRSSDRADYFVGGAVVPGFKTVVSLNGDLERVVVPQSWFWTRPKGPRPDFGKLEIVDCGQTARLGEVKRPHAQTLAVLSRRLGVSPDDESQIGGFARRQPPVLLVHHRYLGRAEGAWVDGAGRGQWGQLPEWGRRRLGPMAKPRSVARRALEGKAEGEAKGKAGALLRILERRGLLVTKVQRALILGATNLAMLDRWIDKALEVDSASQVFTKA